MQKKKNCVLRNNNISDIHYTSGYKFSLYNALLLHKTYYDKWLFSIQLKLVIPDSFVSLWYHGEVSYTTVLNEICLTPVTKEKQLFLSLFLRGGVPSPNFLKLFTILWKILYNWQFLWCLSFIHDLFIVQNNS